jgi:[ribosomal protein S5]-alanine N-acetyltransferase
MQRPKDIYTERLMLRVLLPEEIEALMAGDMRSLEAANGFIFPPDGATRGIDLGWHLRALRADSRHLWWRIRVIVERSSNAVIGSVNLKGPPDEHGDVEIGWGLHESARGKGYATEAAAAVIQWAFQQPYVCSMRATIADDNRGSQLVAQRLGLARSYAIRRDLPLWKIEKIATGD